MPTQRYHPSRITDLPEPKLGKWIEGQRLNTPGAFPVPRYRRHDSAETRLGTTLPRGPLLENQLPQSYALVIVTYIRALPPIPKLIGTVSQGGPDQLVER